MHLGADRSLVPRRPLEVVETDDNERRVRLGYHMPGRVDYRRSYRESTTIAWPVLGLQTISGAYSHRCQIIDGKVPGHCKFPHDIKKEATKVVERHGNRAAVGDAWSTDVTSVEDVVGDHRVSITPDGEVQAVRVVGSASRARPRMGRQETRLLDRVTQAEPE